MVFSSLLFLFLFLPVVLLSNLVLKEKIQNYFLLIASCVFFAWGGVSYFLLLFVSILMNYTVGLGIGYVKKRKHSFYILITGLVLNIGALVVFKYLNFILDNINLYLICDNSNDIEFTRIVLPIGISFFTFQATSYIIDVYRGKVAVQHNFFMLALYISLFPQLIAGPIVRYETVELQLKKRKQNLLTMYEGLKRFCLGLAKKVFIANQMAVIADWAFDSPPEYLSASVAWLGVAAYSFQIYFDFSGYSDMAIGLGKMLGFDFLENFNFPYISKSIKEFWRRWHISLSTWFRDYLYIPLGGNKNGGVRTYVNLLIVFVLTGFWHGASWNFLIWGMIHGLLLIIERLGFEKQLRRLPSFISRVYVIFFVMMSWVFFRAETLESSWTYTMSLFGSGSGTISFVSAGEYVQGWFVILFIIAILASTKFFRKLLINLYTSYRFIGAWFKPIAGYLYMFFTLVFVLGVIFLSSVFLVSSSYNPFIYFRF